MTTPRTEMANILIAALRQKPCCRTQKSILKVLGCLATAPAIATLNQALTDYSLPYDVREEALYAVVRARREDCAKIVQRALHDPSYFVRMLAVRILHIAGENAIPLWIQFLKEHPDPSTRAEATRMLGRKGNKDVIPDLIEAVQGTEGSVQYHATEALIKLARALDCVQEVTSELHRLLRDENHQGRYKMITALADLEGKAAVPLLLTLLQDTDQDVRANAALFLGQLGGKDKTNVVLHLTNALNDNYWMVQVNAATSLGQLGDQSAVPHLIATVQRERNLERERALEALVRLAPNLALPYFQKELAMVSPDTCTWQRAIQSLARYSFE